MNFISSLTQMTFSHFVLHLCTFCSVKVPQFFNSVSFFTVGVQQCHFKGEPLLGLSWCLVLVQEWEPANAGSAWSCSWAETAGKVAVLVDVGSFAAGPCQR